METIEKLEENFKTIEQSYSSLEELKAENDEFVSDEEMEKIKCSLKTLVKSVDKLYEQLLKDGTATAAKNLIIHNKKMQIRID